MKIDADDKAVQDIFSLGYFKIPRFQRPYSWGEDEVNSFWSDIINESGDSYFIGSMVVYQTKRPYFGIVDGQQRLTTITLLLSVIRNGFISLGEENLAKGVHMYIEKANIDNDEEFIISPETSFPYFQTHIQSYNGLRAKSDVGTEEKKLEFAFELLNQNLMSLIPELESSNNIQGNLFSCDSSDSVRILKDLRDKVLSLKLVFIQLDSEEDAYLIFETLNARGLDLTTSDLIKNLILKKLKRKNSVLDDAKESWNSLVKQFNGVNDKNITDSFLLHFWLSKYSYITDRRLFSAVKGYIGDSDAKARLLIEELLDSSVPYSRIVNPADAKWSREEYLIRDSLMLLKSFKVKQQSAMALSLLRAKDANIITLKVLKSVMHKLVCFHYAFNTITSQRSSGSISSNYSKIAIQLSQAQNNDEAQRAIHQLDIFLRSKFPSENEFVVKFISMEYLNKKTKHKPAIAHALRLIVDLPSNGNGLSVDYHNLTIEHLIPQSTRNVDSTVIGSVGNLVLVDSKTNTEELKNSDPMNKIEILKGKGFPVGCNFLETDCFDESFVVERTTKIANRVYALVRKPIFGGIG
ncbi:DUF262 domain-containing protein [Cobetia amphilecti]|uniref:DUF262 domain-containing protein n=1 Tax=Cobetia amphilecti TaxID=1055104 RepID=UPI00254CC9DE|nr:DUF262 domain-containing protein [Cobetia amphilecti]